MHDRYEAAAESRGTSTRRFAVTEIDLLDLVRDIWQAKFIIAAAVILAFLLALFSLSTARKSYTASALLGPAESSVHGGASSSLGQLAGAASMLGVNLGPAADGNDFTKFRSLLTSTSIATEIFRIEGLRTVLFGPGWSPQTQTWQRPTGFLFELKDGLKGFLGLRQWSPPDAFQVQDILRLRLGVLPDKVTGYVTVGISGDSPGDATQVLRAVITSADNLIRRDVRERAASRIRYLHGVLDKTTRQDQREAIISVLSAQEKTMMMVSADRLYAIDLIDPPSASPAPTSPRPTSTVINYVMVSLLLTALWAVARGHFLVRRGGPGSATRPGLDAAFWNRIRKPFRGR